jgi:hypothetical protein
MIGRASTEEVERKLKTVTGLEGLILETEGKHLAVKNH